VKVSGFEARVPAAHAVILCASAFAGIRAGLEGSNGPLDPSLGMVYLGVSPTAVTYA